MCPIDRHLCERAPLFPALFSSQANNDDKAGKGSSPVADWPHSILLIALTVRFGRLPSTALPGFSPRSKIDRRLAPSSQPTFSRWHRRRPRQAFSRALGYRAARERLKGCSRGAGSPPRPAAGCPSSDEHPRRSHGASALRLHQFVGHKSDFSPVPGLELFHDVSDMHLHGALAHVELIGDDLVGLAAP